MNDLAKLKMFHELVRRGLDYNQATKFIEMNPELTTTSTHFDDVLSAHIEHLNEEEHSDAERLDDLEARGFFDGTDDPYEVERIERGNQFEDKLAMYRNEY